MEIETQLFHTILSAIRPGLSKKEIVQEATNFIFTGTHLATFNDQISISYPFETSFKCSVRAEDLYKIITGISAEKIKLEVEDNQLLISGGRTKAGLVVSMEGKIASLIEELDKERHDWNNVPTDFLTGAKLCMFCTSRDATSGVYTCIKVEETEIIGTDSYRASWYQMNGMLSHNPLFLPAKSVASLIGTEVKKYALGQSWIHFQSANGVLFSMRTMTGEFRDVKPIFEVEEEGTRAILPKELGEALTDTLVLSDEESIFDKTSDIKIGDNQIVCEVKKERGWIKKSVDVKYKKTPVEFSVNPIWLSEVLNYTTSVTIYPVKHLAVFQSGNFKHLLMFKITKVENAE